MSLNTSIKRPRRWERAIAPGLALLVLAGCGVAMKTLVGAAPGTEKATPPVAPPVPLPTTAFITDNDLSPGFVNQTILPPTLPPDPDEASAPEPEPIGASGPHKALAAAPLSSDAAALAPLKAAADRQKDLADMRFVLLVLTPPFADAAAMDKANDVTRKAADAALKLLASAGVPAEHVDVSLATSATVGAGEMRLYRR